MASMNDLIEGKVQTEFKEGPKSMNDLIEEVKSTPPIQVNLDTIVKTPDPIAKDIYKFMPHLGTDPITQGMLSQPEGGWNEFGVPIEKGKRILPEIDRPDTLSIDTGKPSLIEQAINKVAGIFGKEYHRKLSPTAKAQATVQLMAKEAGVPLSLYRQSPEFLEQAAHSFVNMASLGLVPAFRESLTGEISFPATSTSGYIGGALGSLVGLFTTPTLMAGKVLAPVISNLPKVTAEAPIVYRMLTESLRDAAILGPAMGLSQAGEALKSTTFSDAATNIWHGVKSGAITGALFGTTRGLLPGSDLTQTATRIASGLVGLNAQRALEVGGNPFINRPVGEVIFDTLLDVAFLAKGMPKGEFAKLGNDIDNIVKKKADIEQKQEIVNNMLDENLKRAQEEIIKVEKVQADLELAELTKKITYDQMIKEDLSSKGRKIEQIKQPKKAIADEVINKAMEKLPEEEVKKTMMSEIEPKEDVTFIDMQEGLNGELSPLVNDKNKLTITYDPEKHNIVNKEEFIKEIYGIEMEPITDLDLQTGTREPLELSTEKSPFRERPERTQQIKAMYETNADKVGRDVEMTTSKLINDVNRWLDGEEVPIGEIRNQLSEFASRADELRYLFDSRTNFDSWKATVSEAAKWARGADRLKNEQSGIKLTMGIDPKDIADMARKLKPFYSKLEEVVKQKLGGKVEVEQMKKMLENSGVSKDEIKNLVGDLSGKVSKQDVLDEIKSNMTEFEDVVLSKQSPENPPLGYEPISRGEVKFSQYTEPGAVPGSYREMFVTTPLNRLKTIEEGRGSYYEFSELRNRIEGWKDGHSKYSDIQNPIVRIRYNEREVNGKRILFIEEIQGPSTDNQSKMPDYLKKRIYDIGVKRVIALAKEQGFDGIAWTTGEMQAKRYDLSQHIGSIDWSKGKSGKEQVRRTSISKPDGTILENFYIHEDGTITAPDGGSTLFGQRPRLEDVVGKELSKKIMASDKDVLSGLDLQVGGEGLKYLYNKQIPSLMKKYGKGDIREIKDMIEDSVKLIYKGPEGTLHDISEILRNQQDYSASIIEAAHIVRREMTGNNLSFKDAMSKGNVKLARLFGGDLYPKTIPVQSISITPKTPSTFSMYSGIDPVDMTKRAVRLVRDLIGPTIENKRASDFARESKKFDWWYATKQLKLDLNQAFIDQSESLLKQIRRDFPKESQAIIDRQRSALPGRGYGRLMYDQMIKEIFHGKSDEQVRLIEDYITNRRFKDIYGYKSEKSYKHPEGYDSKQVVSMTTLTELAKELPDTVWDEVKRQVDGVEERYGKASPKEIAEAVRSAEAFFDWYRGLVDYLVEGHMKTKEEGELLKSHDFSKFKSMEVDKLYDFEYSVKLKGETLRTHNSGVENLGFGSTNILEANPRISAEEMAARVGGSVAVNAAKLQWKGLADKFPDNVYVSNEAKKGWSRMPYFENGVQKEIYFSPDAARFLTLKRHDVSPGVSLGLRIMTMAPITRALAVGVSPAWSTFVGLPMDVIHTLWSAKVWEADATKIRPTLAYPFYKTTKGNYKKIYSGLNPASPLLLGADMARTLTDVYTKGPLFQNLIKHGLSMPFMAARENNYVKGKRPPGDFAKLVDIVSSHGVKMEAWVREATADRVIRNRAKERGMSYEEALKNDDIMYEAVHAARDRMDYNQGGWLVKALDQNGIIFLNASTLGARTFWRSAVENPIDFTLKTMYTMATAAGITATAWSMYPDVMKDIPNEGNEKNLVFPLFPESLSFEDENGDTRYFYAKLRMDPGQAFMYRLSEALTRTYLYDRGILSAEPDYWKLTKSLKQLGPVGISLPPSIQMGVDYSTNYSWWKERQMYTDNGGKTFDWPNSRFEGMNDNRVSQIAKDVGSVTGLSPKRLQGSVSNVIPSNNEFVYLFGTAYEQAFSDVPKEARKKPWMQTLAEIPGVNRVIGITSPGYSRGQIRNQVNEDVELKNIIVNSKFNELAENYAWHGVGEVSKVYEYMNSLKDKDKYDRMKDDLKFMIDVKNLPHRSSWLGLRRDSIEKRARSYIEMTERATDKELGQIRSEYEFIKSKGGLGIITDEFRKEVEKFKSVPKP